jgi:hypothetical protein
MRASGLANPKAMRVMRRIFVLTDSMGPLNRPCSIAGEDRGLVLDDGSLEFDEHCNAAAAGPGAPGLEGLDGPRPSTVDPAESARLLTDTQMKYVQGTGDPGTP